MSDDADAVLALAVGDPETLLADVRELGETETLQYARSWLTLVAEELRTELQLALALAPRTTTVVPPRTGPVRGEMLCGAVSSYSKLSEPAYCWSFCVTSTRTKPASCDGATARSSATDSHTAGTRLVLNRACV